MGPKRDILDPKLANKKGYIASNPSCAFHWPESLVERQDIRNKGTTRRTMK